MPREAIDTLLVKGLRRIQEVRPLNTPPEPWPGVRGLLSIASHYGLANFDVVGLWLVASLLDGAVLSQALPSFPPPFTSRHVANQISASHDVRINIDKCVTGTRVSVTGLRADVARFILGMDSAGLPLTCVMASRSMTLVDDVSMRELVMC